MGLTARQPGNLVHLGFRDVLESPVHVVAVVVLVAIVQDLVHAQRLSELLVEGNRLVPFLLFRDNPSLHALPKFVKLVALLLAFLDGQVAKLFVVQRLVPKHATTASDLERDFLGLRLRQSLFVERVHSSVETRRAACFLAALDERTALATPLITV